MLAELKDIHQIHDWLMKENNHKEGGDNNRENTVSLNVQFYAISFEGADSYHGPSYNLQCAKLSSYRRKRPKNKVIRIEK